LRAAARHGLWLFPVLFYPLYRQSLRHALEKDSAIGFYLDDHFEGFLANIGVPFFLLVLVGATAPLWLRRARDRHHLLFAGLALLYLVPIFFAAPPGITVVRNYTLIGAACGVLAGLYVFDMLAQRWRAPLLAVTCLAGAVTAYGVVTELFPLRLSAGPLAANLLRIRVERGVVPPDPLIKAGGYLYRRNIPPQSRTLSLHGSVEPPTYRYYFGGDARDVVFYDLPHANYAETLARFRDGVAVIIADVRAAELLAKDTAFHERISVTLRPVGPPGLRIFARPDLPVPELREFYAPLNAAFDRDFSPCVSLFR
jgi:hypothetical protein